MASLYLVNIGSTIESYQARATAGYFPPLMEFTPTYGASMLVRDQSAQALYAKEPMHDFTRNAVMQMYPDANPIWLGKVRYPPWYYPPHFILLIMPLAWLPFWSAFVAWGTATAIPYLLCAGRILPLKLALPLALAMPPFFYNALQGQTGFLSAGLIGLGLTLLRDRPWLAGLLIGLASIKPHFGLLIPVALVAGGYWRTFASASLMVIGLVALTAIIFGAEIWGLYFNQLQGSVAGFEDQIYSYTPMVTVLAAAVQAGLTLETARLLQFISLLFMVGLVAWCWSIAEVSTRIANLQRALLCIATLLALPVTFIYDLLLLTPAVAWLVKEFQNNGAHRYEWGLLIVLSAALLGLLSLASNYQIQPAPLLLLALLALTLRRLTMARSALRASRVTELPPQQLR